MPPNLALLICTTYVLFLLRIEHKQSSNVSSAVWITTLWMLSIASKPLSTWLSSGSEESGSNVLDQAFLLGLLGMGFTVLTLRKFSWSQVLGDNILLVSLLAYSLASIVWSDIPADSLKRWVREIIAVVMAFIILSEKEPRQAMQSLFRRIIYILIPFSIILIKYFPELGRRYDSMGELNWIGVTLQKNGLGRLCLIAFFFQIWTFIRRWQKKDISISKLQTLAELSVFSITTFLIIGPGGQYSATALISLAGGLSVLVWLLWAKKHDIIMGSTNVVVLMAFVFVIGTLQPFLGGTIIKNMASDLGRDATLTGRTEIWASLIPDVMEKPILGYGFASFWTPKTVLLHDIGEAHNGYMDIALDIGFFGLLIFFLFILSSCRKAQKCLIDDFDWGCLWICYILMALIHNITESSFDSFTSHLPAVILFLTISSGTVVTSSVTRISDPNKTLARFDRPRFHKYKKIKPL